MRWVSCNSTFLVKQGLRPSHVLLDIACGSLRAGRLLIPYLAPGNYLGIDKHSEVIEAGKANEIEAGVLKAQRPEFVDCFSFEKFSKRPDFCIAQSLFSHLDKRDIELCFLGNWRLLLGPVANSSPVSLKCLLPFRN